MNPGGVDVGLVSYLSAAVAYAAFAVLMLTSWRGRLQGGLLVLACLVSVVWAGYSGYIAYSAMSETSGQAYSGFYLLDVLRNWAWYLFLLKLLSPLRAHQPVLAKLFRYAVPGTLILSLGILTLDLLPDVFITRTLSLGGIDPRLLGHFIMAVIGLVLVEQLYRNTREDSRWAVKYLFLGLGSLFIYDFFMYADAVLFHHLDYGLWQARGLVNAAVVPMLAVSAARNNEWSLDVFVSRKIVFHAVSLLGAGLYLLAMSVAGFYIRDFGGSWGTAAQVAFLFFSILLLLTMLFSGQLRARIKVFFNKHFFNYSYDYRDEWLKLSSTLTARSQGRDVRENTVKALADIVDSPGGILFVRNDIGNYSYSAHWNMDEGLVDSIPADNAMIRFMRDKNWIVDLKNHKELRECGLDVHTPACLQAMSRAWLVVPLLQDEDMMGFVILMKSRAPKPLNWESRDLLKTVALQIASHVALLKASEELMAARQFDAFNRLSSYVVHDLKNVTAQLSLIVSNSLKFQNNKEFVADAFSTVENAVNKMNRMLAQLRKGDKGQDRKSVANLSDIMMQVIALCKDRAPVPVIRRADSECETLTDIDRLTHVLAHIVRNAQEATPENGYITIDLLCNGENVIVEIEDSGCGMEAGFVCDRLFRPFDTTKGNAGMGIGVYECRDFIWSQGGEISVKSTPGEGTVFRISLPRFGEKNPETEKSPDTLRLIN